MLSLILWNYSLFLIWNRFIINMVQKRLMCPYCNACHTYSEGRRLSVRHSKMNVEAIWIFSSTTGEESYKATSRTFRIRYIVQMSHTVYHWSLSDTVSVCRQFLLAQIEILQTIEAFVGGKFPVLFPLRENKCLSIGWNIFQFEVYGVNQKNKCRCSTMTTYIATDFTSTHLPVNAYLNVQNDGNLSSTTSY